MLALFGRDEVLRNLYALARLQDASAEIRTSEQLRRLYLDFLASRYPWAPVNMEDDLFIADREREDGLSAAFSEGLLNDLGQAEVVGPSYPAEVRDAKISFARAALANLLTLDSDLQLVFNLLIHSIFVKASKPVVGAKGSHGGSSSTSIGAIWLTVSDSATTRDVMEMFVHELTHHLLFIDELNYGQFDYAAIARPENFAHSAILKRTRPLDKVVHSIVVATEILAARRHLLGDDSDEITVHPPTPDLIAETLTAVESVYALSNLSELITEHTHEILRRCSDALSVAPF